MQYEKGSKYQEPAERAARRRVERRLRLRTRSIWYRDQTRTPCSRYYILYHCNIATLQHCKRPLGLGISTSSGRCTRCLGPLRSACTVVQVEVPDVLTLVQTPTRPLPYTVAHTEHGGLGHRALHTTVCPNKIERDSSRCSSPWSQQELERTERVTRGRHSLRSTVQAAL